MFLGQILNFFVNYENSCADRFETQQYHNTRQQIALCFCRHYWSSPWVAKLTKNNFKQRTWRQKIEGISYLLFLHYAFCLGGLEEIEFHYEAQIKANDHCWSAFYNSTVNGKGTADFFPFDTLCQLIRLFFSCPNAIVTLIL